MYEVNIYIATSGGVSAKHGCYGYIVEYITSRGETKTCEGFGQEDETTSQRMTLRALAAALGRLTKRCMVTLYIPDPFIRGGIASGRFAGRSGIRNAELWQAVYKRLAPHTVSVSPDKNHMYKTWMKGKMNSGIHNAGRK